MKKKNLVLWRDENYAISPSAVVFQKENVPSNLMAKPGMDGPIGQRATHLELGRGIDGCFLSPSCLARGILEFWDPDVGLVVAEYFLTKLRRAKGVAAMANGRSWQFCRPTKYRCANLGVE